MKRISVATLIGSTLLTASLAFACNVPVFRYALERWPADSYEVVVLHEDPLSPSSNQLVTSLKQHGRSVDGLSNFNVHTIPIENVEDELLEDVWQQYGRKGQAVMALLYPRNARDVPDRLVAAAPLTPESIKAMVDSPVRRKLADELLAGESAVWVYVPSGNQEQDEAALARLSGQVTKAEKELELPPQDEIESDEFFRIENPIELRLGFSIIELDRDDPSEKFFLSMLLGSEADLETLDQPMAFPVIGRGRVLYALVGKGIYADTIQSASRFVVGPCSCQVKEQNPGFDLLLSVPWDEKVGGSVLSEPALETKRSAKPVLIDIPPGK